MTMLEDDLRETFAARVRTSPNALDPAGAAIRRGRRAVARRRAVIGALATVIFAALLGGMASIQGLWDTRREDQYRATFDSLFAPGLDPPQRSSGSLPIISMPVDVHVGTALWTTDGRRLTLPGVNQVIEVVRVPEGWLYSDDFRLRMLTLSGKPVPLRDNVSAWAVSPDGGTVATISPSPAGTELELLPAEGGAAAKTAVPRGTRPIDFDGKHVVLSRDGYGTDHWSGGTAGFRETWHERLLAVYGGPRSGDAIGIVSDGASTCLTEVRATTEGWETGTLLGCGDVVAAAARAGYGQSRAARSPDGRWLAVPSPTGVHLIDIAASRAAASQGAMVGLPVITLTCLSTADAPAVWADFDTVLTIGTGNGVIACGTDGSRHAVQLPPGVTDGWALVRRYGVID